MSPHKFEYKVKKEENKMPDKGKSKSGSTKNGGKDKGKGTKKK